MLDRRYPGEHLTLPDLSFALGSSIGELVHEQWLQSVERRDEASLG